MLDSATPVDNGASGPGAPWWSRGWVRIAAGTAGALLLAAGLAWWLWPPPEPAEIADDNDEELERLLTVVNPGYVGIETCAECHKDRAAEFKTTRHYVACVPANGSTVTAAGFAPGRGRCETRWPNVRFEMSRSGDDFLATSITTAHGDERLRYELALVYGSANKRDERYFAWKDDRLVHLPLAWLYPQDCWGTDVDNFRVLDTSPSCLECHNTWVTHVPGTPIRYRKSEMFLGVTCERCHGPGREHVTFHRANKSQEAHAVVHPGTLGRERLIEVCAQCHANTRILNKPFAYRPGTPLARSHRIVRARYREDDTTTNQVQYLGESKCFQNSKMTCITCHDPHRPTPPQYGCATCHTPAACKDQPHQPAAVRANCVGCHMPQQIWMNSHFYTVPGDNYVPVAPRSEHRIAVYPLAKKAVVLAWLRKQTDAASKAEAERLTAELTAHWLGEAEQMRQAGRLKAAMGAYREALQLTPSPETRKRLQEVTARQIELDDLQMELDAGGHSPDESIQLLTKILQIRPDDARAHSELGTAYATTDRHAQALPHLQAVAKYDPFDSSGLTRLAWLAHIEGRPDDAVALCTQAAEIEPENPGNHFVWAMALAKLRRWAEAEKHFRKTLETDPTHSGANRGLSEAVRYQGRPEEAVRYGRRAVRFGPPKDAEALLTLGEAFAAAKRLPEARQTYEQALAAVGAGNPALTQTIRKRLLEID